MMKPGLRALALLAPCCALLLSAACGSTDQSTAPASPGSAVEQTATTTAPASAAPAPQPVKTQSARFQGVLPCADCPGIDTTLVLQSDELGRRSFSLEMRYQESGSISPLVRSGTWQLERDPATGATLLRLHVGTEGKPNSYALQPDGSLLMLGMNGKPPASGLAYTLERTAGNLELAKTASNPHPSVRR